MNLRDVKTDEFDKLINDNKIVFVDFWAPWCGPCRMLAPTLEQLAKNNPNIVVAKANIDEEDALADRFDIRTIPTIVLFIDGKPVEKVVGVKGVAHYEELILCSTQ